MFELNRKLLNPTNFQTKKLIDESRDYYVTLQKIYDMAYELLCQTIGEEHIKAPIDIYEVAERLGFRIYEEKDHQELLNRAKSQIKQRNLGKLPYVEIYDDKELNPLTELRIHKNLFNGTSVPSLKIADYLSEISKRYCIALTIAQLYFADEQDFTELISEAKYSWGLNVLDTTQSQIERIFAYALLAPDKIMLEVSEKYRKDNSKWPLDFADLIQEYKDSIQMPTFHIAWMFQYWKGLRTYKYTQSISKNKTGTPTIPKASLLNKYEADVYGLSMLRKTARCIPLDYAVILGSTRSSNHLVSNANESTIDYTCRYWLKSTTKEDTAYAVDVNGRFEKFDISARNIAIRPKFTWSEISGLCVNIKKNENDELEAEYGYWPSSVGNKEEQIELEALFNSDKLTKVDLTAGADSIEAIDHYKEFSKEAKSVYEYEGTKWIRIKISYEEGREYIRLSNGEVYKGGNTVWVQLEPLKLLIDEEHNTAVAKNAISAGVSYQDLNQYLDFVSNELYLSALLLQQENKLGQEKSTQKRFLPNTTN